MDKVLQKSGLTAKHDKKYDLIYDCFGEDHFLKKELVGKSILRSISLLKKGGLLFTVIPVVFKPSSHNFTASEAKKMLAELRKKKPNIRVSKSEERKRIGFVEFTDLILRIEKL